MSFSRTGARSALVNQGKELLQDVITRQDVCLEVDLSSVLALKHNWKQIKWGKVDFYPVTSAGISAGISALSLGIEDLVAQCEYPLCSTSHSSAEQSWGGFRADILFLSKTNGPLIYVENKIGDTIKIHYIEGVLKFLEQQTQFDRPSFVILTGREFVEHQWYLSELKSVLNEHPELSKKVKSYLLYWEDVIKSCDAT